MLHKKNVAKIGLYLLRFGYQFHILVPGRRIGCFKDKKSARAISGGYVTMPTDTLQKCYEHAISSGFTVFAVQAGNQCFTSATAGETYSIYGESTACASGRGGSWAMDVYTTLQSEYIHNMVWN